MNFMHTALVRPIFRLGHQSGAHRILLNIKPFLVVILLIPQTMMKAASLKFADDDLSFLVGRRCVAAAGRAAACLYPICGRAAARPYREFLCELIFPETNPTLDGEFQIARGAE